MRQETVDALERAELEDPVVGRLGAWAGWGAEVLCIAEYGLLDEWKRSMIEIGAHGGENLVQHRAVAQVGSRRDGMAELERAEERNERIELFPLLVAHRGLW